MIALSRLIIRCADWRAVSASVAVSPLTDSTSKPRTPSPLRSSKVSIQPPPLFRCFFASWYARSSSSPSEEYGPVCGTLNPNVTVSPSTG
jgi:hypothetical protein